MAEKALADAFSRLSSSMTEIRELGTVTFSKNDLPVNFAETSRRTRYKLTRFIYQVTMLKERQEWQQKLAKLLNTECDRRDAEHAFLLLQDFQECAARRQYHTTSDDASVRVNLKRPSTRNRDKHHERPPDSVPLLSIQLLNRGHLT